MGASLSKGEKSLLRFDFQEMVNDANRTSFNAKTNVASWRLGFVILTMTALTDLMRNFVLQILQDSFAYFRLWMILMGFALFHV